MKLGLKITWDTRVLSVCSNGNRLSLINTLTLGVGVGVGWSGGGWGELTHKISSAREGSRTFFSPFLFIYIYFLEKVAGFRFHSDRW